MLVLYYNYKLQSKQKILSFIYVKKSNFIESKQYHWHCCKISALMQKSDPPQFCHYNCIFANIWYLILLIQLIIIVLRIFIFYKQRVLAYFWGRKDSAICASRNRSGACVSYCAVHMEWAINSLFMPTPLSFRPENDALFIKHKYAQDYVKWLN